MTGRATTARTIERAALAGAVVFVTYLIAAPGSGWTVNMIDNVVQLLVPAAAAVAAFVVASRSTGRLRSSWVLLGIAAASWAAGQAIWTWFEVVRQIEVPSPSAADAGYVLAVPFLIVGLARYPVAGLFAIGRLRLLVDAGIMGLGLLFAAHGTFLAAVLDAEGSIAARVVAVTYPVADVIAIAVVGAVLVHRHDGWRGPLPRLFAGLAFLTAADCSYVYLTATGTLGDAPVNAGWVLGWGLVALAALRVEPEVSTTPQRMPANVESIVPAAPVGLAACVLVYRAAYGEGVGPLLCALGAALLVCLAIRQFLAQLENTELTDDLETKVHELRDREDELEHRAFHDPLTGLANRDLFRNRLDHALHRRRLEPVTVVFVDLDDFKTVNDSLGHDAGDRLLVLVAERLRASVRGGDTAARLGGDEFAVLLEETEGETMGRRILASLESPFTIDNRELVVGASIGVASGTPGITTAEELLQDADLAMYAAKAAGKRRVARFEPAMREGAVERLDLLHDLDVALERGQLVLHYQPVVRLGEHAGEVAGYEALLRWHHPERGVLAPAAFLQLAEETGRILPIGWWILEEACRAQTSFPTQTGVVAPAVSVNLSARQLADPHAPQAVAHALAVSGVDPGRVVLELPETTLLAGEEETQRLHALRALGVRLAIDDFGTGYSSLGYLSRLPIDIVKIDRSFLERMDGGGTEELLVGAVVQLAKALGLRTVAEGVETRFQLERLEELGCDSAQGYFLGRPQPVPAEFSERRLG